MIDLRDYQRDIVARARLVRRPCIVMPTGSGKTLVASEIIRSEPDRHVLFLAHRRELIHQAAAKLGELGVNVGVILAGEPTNVMLGVQVASVQTVWSRSFRSKSLELPPAGIVFIDEAHHVRAPIYKAIIEKYPDAKIIGLTATPCRRDGRGLGNVFDALVEGPQVSELIAQGFLVGTKVFAPSKPNLKGVHTRQGDYIESELAERMDKVELVGDIVSHWHRLSERRKTVVFATSVAHSVHLKDEFERSGVRAEHIDGSTPKGERDEILDQLARGDIEVVTNCLVLTEGWDASRSVLHRSCSPHEISGPISADGWPSPSTLSRQRARVGARSCWRRIPAWLRRRPGDLDSRCRQARRDAVASGPTIAAVVSAAGMRAVLCHPHRWPGMSALWFSSPPSRPTYRRARRRSRPTRAQWKAEAQ